MNTKHKSLFSINYAKLTSMDANEIVKIAEQSQAIRNIFKQIEPFAENNKLGTGYKAYIIFKIYCLADELLYEVYSGIDKNIYNIENLSEISDTVYSNIKYSDKIWQAVDELLFEYDISPMCKEQYNSDIQQMAFKLVRTEVIEIRNNKGE